MATLDSSLKPNPHPGLGNPARVPVSGTAEPAHLLDVQVDKLARRLALIVAHRFGRVETREPSQSLALEPSRHGGPCQPESPLRSSAGSGGDVGPTLPPARAGVRQAGWCWRGLTAQHSRKPNAGLATCAPCPSKQQRPWRPRGRIVPPRSREDLLSTAHCKTGPMVWVVHPSGSSSRVCRLQPETPSG